MKCLVKGAAGIAAILLAACSEPEEGPGERIWDFVNPGVCFFVTDAATGENLLDPAAEHSIADKPISVTWEGRTYPLVDESAAPQARATRVRPLALRLERRDPLGNIDAWHLSFGDFSPTENYRDRKFTVHWDDGTRTEVEFSLYIVWKNHEPDVRSPISVDGKACGSGYYDGWQVRIER